MLCALREVSQLYYSVSWLCRAPARTRQCRENAHTVISAAPNTFSYTLLPISAFLACCRCSFFPSSSPSAEEISRGMVGLCAQGSALAYASSRPKSATFCKKKGKEIMKGELNKIKFLANREAEFRVLGWLNGYCWISGSFFLDIFSTKYSLIRLSRNSCRPRGADGYSAVCRAEWLSEVLSRSNALMLCQCPARGSAKMGVLSPVSHGSFVPAVVAG